jgi:hypothetical protein
MKRLNLNTVQLEDWKTEVSGVEKNSLDHCERQHVDHEKNGEPSGIHEILINKERRSCV